MESVTSLWHGISITPSLLFGPKLAMGLALLTVLLLFAGASKHVSSFLGASLLAVMGFSIAVFGGFERISLIVGCSAGRLLVSFMGMNRRRGLINLRVKLDQMSSRLTALEVAESRRSMAELRSDGPKLIQPPETDNVGKAKDHLSEQIPQPGDHGVTKIH